MIEFKLSKNVHGESRLSLELTGTSDVFRFAINMLDDQVEFCHAANVILVELREAVGPDRFDPFARSLLGVQRYDKLASYFLREDHCCVCEADIEPGQPYARLSGAQAACADCAIPDLVVTG